MLSTPEKMKENSIGNEGSIGYESKGIIKIGNECNTNSICPAKNENKIVQKKRRRDIHMGSTNITRRVVHQRIQGQYTRENEKETV